MKRPVCEDRPFVYDVTKNSVTIVTLSTHMVGMTRFELATTRPPDVYSNRAELHPEAICGAKIITIFQIMQIYNKKNVTLPYETMA